MRRPNVNGPADYELRQYPFHRLREGVSAAERPEPERIGNHFHICIQGRPY